MITMSCLNGMILEMNAANIDYNRDFDALSYDFDEYSEVTGLSWATIVDVCYKTLGEYCHRRWHQVTSKVHTTPEAIEAELGEKFWTNFNRYIVLDVVVKLSDAVLQNKSLEDASMYFQDVRDSFSSRVEFASTVLG